MKVPNIFNNISYGSREELVASLRKTCMIERKCKFYDDSCNECIFDYHEDNIEECKCEEPDDMFRLKRC